MNTTINKVHCSKCEKSINILTESVYLDINGNEICQDCWNEYLNSQLSTQIAFKIKTMKK